MTISVVGSSKRSKIQFQGGGGPPPATPAPTAAPTTTITPAQLNVTITPSADPTVTATLVTPVRDGAAQTGMAKSLPDPTATTFFSLTGQPAGSSWTVHYAYVNPKGTSGVSPESTPALIYTP